MRHKYKGSILGLSPLTELCQRIGEVDCMISNAVLRCAGPKVGDVGIISEGQNASLGHIVSEKMSRPEDPRRFIGPSSLAISSQAVHEDNAGL